MHKAQTRMTINNRVTHSHFTFHSYLFIFNSFLTEEQKRDRECSKEDIKKRLQIHDLQPLSGERGIDKSIPSLPRASLQKKAGKTLQINLRILPVFFCGERGIRTPGTSQYNGFQDRRNRPLCHLSKPLFKSACFQKRCKCTTIF